MQLIISTINNSISLNNQLLSNIDSEYFDSISENVVNFYWYNTYGEIQYKDNSMEIVKELGIYENFINVFNSEIERLKQEKIEQEEKERLEEEKKNQEYEKYLEELENSRDYWQELRFIRNQKLKETDWTQLPDNPLTEEQKQSWILYRQYLRDLPSIIEDPKPLVLDFNHSQWTLSEPSQGT